MKFVKLSIFALTMGLFIASCGGNTEAEAPAEDTTMAQPAEPTPAPVADTTAAPATTDSAAAAAPAAH